MGNASTSFFYWYRRYKVRAADMNLFQQSMVETARGLGEGLSGAAVLRGMDVSTGSGLSLDVSAGIAQGASGYLHVTTAPQTIDLTGAATGSFPSRALLVASPNVVDTNFIPSPTSPFSQVPLNGLQQTTLKVIAGVSAQQPDYPSKGAEDAIICGLMLPAGVTQLTAAMLDFEVRENVGTNSDLQKRMGHADDRLRPFRVSPTTLAIKSSQTSGSGPRLLSYATGSTACLFPLAAGVHNDNDTLINLATGAISGGDATTPAFTPVIPSAGNSVILAVGLNTDQTLSFAYGTPGTFAQCLAAIEQQTPSGPGSLPNTGGVFPVATVIVSSVGGVYSDAQVLDARPVGGGGSGGGGTSPIFVQETPTGAVNGSNAAFVISQLPKSAASLLVLIDGIAVPSSEYSLSVKTITMSAGSIPAFGQTILVYYVTTGPSPVQAFQEAPGGAVDGTNDTFTLSFVPGNQVATLLMVDGLAVPPTEWSLLQSLGVSSVKFNAGSIPQPGQSIWVYSVK